MGLGRLNPGCQCMCEVIPAPTNSCQLAGQFWNPTKVTLTCQSFGGSAPLLGCGESPPLCGDALRPNPSTVSTSIPRYFEDGFVCGYGASSYGNYQTGSFGAIRECIGMWPIWTSGSCLIGLANFVQVGTFRNWTYPYFANGYIEFSYSPALNVGYLTARIIVSALVFSGTGTYYGSGACPDAPSLLPPQAGGQNWQFTSSGFDQSAIEVNGPPIRTSRYRWQPGAAYGIPGTPGTFPTWCSDFHSYATVFSESTYSIATNDPVYGDKRTFELWTPSPAIDELGLTINASVSIETSV